uniref:LapA_dom domain-containing protein n=1 Tax=Panagrellus redivivus TaxID=6233 RepID=A0A7E4UYD2_PANRE
MNVQAILFTVILAIGILMILIPSNEKGVSDENSRMSKGTIAGVTWSGVVLTVIGVVGLIYTLGEIVLRGYRKHHKNVKRKLETQEYNRTRRNTQPQPQKPKTVSFIDTNSHIV